MLTQSKLIKEFAKLYRVSENDASIWIKSIFDYLYDAIIYHDSVKIPRLGMITKDYVFPRRYYNINTRSYEESDPHMTIVYTPTKSLISAIRDLPPNPELARACKMKQREIHKNLPSKLSPEEIAALHLGEQENSVDEDYDNA